MKKNRPSSGRLSVFNIANWEGNYILPDIKFIGKRAINLIENG